MSMSRQEAYLEIFIQTKSTVEYTADATFTRLENKVWFENSAIT